MRYRAADALVRRVGFELHNPDPDGPPVGAIAWEDDLVVTDQDPAPGDVIEPDSVLPSGIKVWFVSLSAGSDP